MDLQLFVPFIPFFATFFGVLAAFGLQWLAKRYDREKDRQQFLQEIKKELESCSKFLTGKENLLPTDMWESGKASGWLNLINHEVKTQFASIYFRIECHNYEAEKVGEMRILAVLDEEKLYDAFSNRLRESEAELRKDIDSLLRQNIWGKLES